MATTTTEMVGIETTGTETIGDGIVVLAGE